MKYKSALETVDAMFRVEHLLVSVAAINPARDKIAIKDESGDWILYGKLTDRGWYPSFGVVDVDGWEIVSKAAA